MLSFGRKQAQALLPKRKKSDNKSRGGKCLIIAGHERSGAAILAVTAAFRTGAGYVYLATHPKKISNVKHPDFLMFDFKKQKPTQIFSAYAIGPGMGVSRARLADLKRLLKLRPPQVVLDADALTLCAKYKLSGLPQSWVLTPHEAELARLLETSAAQIRKNRKKAVLAAQKKMGCVVLLKGFKTWIATPEALYKIKSGNVALAKAGTGDVLTGMITGFMAQGLPSAEAAVLGAYVHGWIADRWIKNKDELSLMASDLLNGIPKALHKIRSN